MLYLRMCLYYRSPYTKQDSIVYFIAEMSAWMDIHRAIDYINANARFVS